MLNRTICCIIRRTIVTNTKTHYALQNSLNLNSKRYNLCSNYLCLQQNYNLITFKRFESKQKASKHHKRDEDEEEDEDESIDVDDYLYTNKSKIIETTIPSLRLDAIAKVGFGMSRTKLDKEFYKSNLRVNGKKCLKKSVLVQIGDEIDYVLNRSPDNPKFLIVNRCVLTSVSADSESIRAKLLQNKSLLIEDYDDPWNGVKS